MSPPATKPAKRKPKKRAPAKRKPRKRTPPPAPFAEPATGQDLEAVEKQLAEYAAKQGDGKGLNSLERVERDELVMAALARGLRPVTVAEQVGLSDRQVRTIRAAWREHRSRGPQPAPMDVLDDTLELVESAIERAALLVESCEHEGTKLGALRSVVEFSAHRLELLTALGRVPRQLGAMGRERDVREVADAMLDVLKEEGVEAGVLERLAEVAYGKRGPGADVVPLHREGRA